MKTKKENLYIEGEYSVGIWKNKKELAALRKKIHNKEPVLILLKGETPIGRFYFHPVGEYVVDMHDHTVWTERTSIVVSEILKNIDIVIKRAKKLERKK